MQCMYNVQCTCVGNGGVISKKVMNTVQNLCTPIILQSATYLVETLSFYSPFSAPNNTTLFLTQ